MNTPVMIFLSVEPFEVRLEVLLKADLVDPAIEAEKKILVEDQKELLENTLDSLTRNFNLFIDGQPARHEKQSINFVTLNRGGVSIRSNPVPNFLKVL